MSQRIKYHQFVDRINREPEFAWWLSGLIDGEGCFQIVQQHRIGYGCQFHITLRSDDTNILTNIHNHLGIGNLNTYLAKPPTRPITTWQVKARNDCGCLDELLQRYPLRTKKARDYECWHKALALWLNRIPYAKRNADEFYDEMQGLASTLKEGRKWVNE